MTNLYIGDCVTFRARAYFVRGMSPMSAVRRRLQLQDVDSGEYVEVSFDDIHDDALGDGWSADSTDPARHGGANATQ